MRELIARVICGVTVGVVLVLSLLFAFRHNPADGTQAPKENARGSTVAGDPEIERGRRVYMENDCASCHAIAGRGNPRHPLDGVGARRASAELQQYVTGTGAAARSLPSAVVRRKGSYREMREDEMAALVRYLSSLSGEK